MEEKIEKLYKDIENSIIKNPVNKFQVGFNMGIEAVHSKLSHILGKSNIYTYEELIKELES